MLEQMLDLDGRIVGDGGKFGVQRFHDGHGVGGAVEEIRIAEGDVAGARRRFAGGYRPKRRRARRFEMPRYKPASPGNAGRRVCSRGWLRCRPPAWRRSCRAAWRSARAPAKSPRCGVTNFWRSSETGGAVSPAARRTRLDSNSPPAMDFHAQPAQQIRVDRRVQSVAGQARARIQLPDAFDHRQGQTRGGVHGQIERDPIGLAGGILRQRLDGEIGAGDRMPGASEPSRGRRQPERLMPQLIGRNQAEFARYPKVCTIRLYSNTFPQEDIWI